MDVKRISLWTGPLFAVGVGATLWALDLETNACLTAAVTALVAVWWITEPIPIPATSLIPFAAFPLLGVMDAKQTSAALGDDVLLLFLGGFLLSLAMEKSGAHRRLALGMVRLIGIGSRRRLVLGFMLACLPIHFAMSNTATILMMLPVALALLEHAEDRDILAAPLLLGITYGVSVGGMLSPLGTPPNMIFIGAYREATGQEVNFLSWMAVSVPIVALMLPVTWWWVTRGLRGRANLRLPPPEPWRVEEKRVLVIFTLTAVAWITRQIPGWGWGLYLGAAGDSTVAMAAAVALFIVSDGRGGRLLDWPTALKVPWGILLLFAGGLAIAKAFEVSGLADAIAGKLGVLAEWPRLPMIAVICLTVTFFSEIASNTAIAILLMPLLAATAQGAGLDPMLLMLPAALAASMGFMLPVATPPNAVAFATGHIPMSTMIRKGFTLDLAGAAVITVVCYLLLG